MSKVSIRIATEERKFLKTYLLIALDKCICVRQIGLGEVLRRMIDSSIVKSVEGDFQLVGKTYISAFDKRLASNILLMHSADAFL